MARLPRAVAAGLPHLVVQRTAGGHAAFVDPEDCLAWRQALQHAARAHEVAVHAWVILPAESQMVLSAPRPAALAGTLQSLSRRFLRRYNARHARTGGLWEPRFRSTVLEPEAWLLDATQAVETAPVSAGLVDDPALYRWGSYVHHAGIALDPLITDHAVMWALGNTPFDRQSTWRARLEAPLPPARLAALRAAAMRGWPLGSPQFVAELDLPGRTAPRAPRPRGRPPRGRPA